MDEMFAKLMGELEKLSDNIGRLADMVGRAAAKGAKAEPIKAEAKAEPIKAEAKAEPIKAEAKAEPVDVSTVRQALFQVMEKCGRGKAMELLATHGNAPTVGEVLPEKYAGIIAACREALK